MVIRSQDICSLERLDEKAEDIIAEEYTAGCVRFAGNIFRGATQSPMSLCRKELLGLTSLHAIEVMELSLDLVIVAAA
jgi:hypothetical protein